MVDEVHPSGTKQWVVIVHRDKHVECGELAIFIHLRQSSDGLSSAILAKKTPAILSFDSR